MGRVSVEGGKENHGDHEPDAVRQFNRMVKFHHPRRLSGGNVWRLSVDARVNHLARRRFLRPLDGESDEIRQHHQRPSRARSTFVYCCLPADIFWNRSFKSRLREYWVENLREQLKVHTDSRDSFKLQPPRRSQLCDWIKASWDSLSASTITSRFHKTHISQPFPLVQPLDSAVMTLLDDLELLDGRMGDVSSDDDIDDCSDHSDSEDHVS